MRFLIVTSLVMFTSQANSAIFCTKNLKNDLYSMLGWMPNGTCYDNKVEPDAVDKALLDITKEFVIEVGSIEILDAEGRILAIEAFSSNTHSNISGRATYDALRRIENKLETYGLVDKIATIKFRHTHPDEGSFTQFSPADKIAGLAMKAGLEYASGHPLTMDLQLLFAGSHGDIRKKSIIIPSSVRHQNNDYKFGTELDSIYRKSQPHLKNKSAVPIVPSIDTMSLAKEIYSQLHEQAKAGTVHKTSIGAMSARLETMKREFVEQQTHLLYGAANGPTYLHRLHLLINYQAEPFSFDDHKWLKKVIGETMHQHFPQDLTYIDILRRVYELRGTVNLPSTDQLLFDLHVDSVEVAIVEILALDLSQEAKDFLLEIAENNSKHPRFAPAKARRELKRIAKDDPELLGRIKPCSRLSWEWWTSLF